MLPKWDGIWRPLSCCSKYSVFQITYWNCSNWSPQNFSPNLMQQSLKCSLLISTCFLLALHTDAQWVFWSIYMLLPWLSSLSCFFSCPQYKNLNPFLRCVSYKFGYLFRNSWFAFYTQFCFPRHRLYKWYFPVSLTGWLSIRVC